MSAAAGPDAPSDGPASLHGDDDYYEHYGRWLSALNLDQPSPRIRRTLYHFTTVAALESMLRTQTLWCSHFTDLNDPTELRHGQEITRRIAERMIREFPEVPFATALLPRLLARLDDEALGSVSCYIASFCASVGDLTQWRLYADDATGVAVGFRPESFAPEGIRLSPTFAAFPARVHYTDEKLPKRYAVPMGLAAAIFVNGALDRRGLWTPETLAGFTERFADLMLAQPLMWTWMTTKTAAYRSEREMRLVLMGRPEEGAVRARERNGKTVRYVELPFDRRAAISSVIVGPAADPAVVDLIRGWVHTMGLTRTRIKRSELPYRR